MDKETWELLIKSFKKDPNRKPSYLVILNGIEYELIYNVEPYGKFAEKILVKDRQSGYLIGTMYKDFFSGYGLDKIQYKENDTLINIIDRMEYYNNKREEERKAEIERREKKLNSFLYGDG